MNNVRIQAFGKANPPLRLTQQETFRMVGYTDPRVLRIFLNSGIDFRHFYIDPERFNPDETPDEMNRRFLSGTMHTGRRAVTACLEQAKMTPRDVDFFVVCTCTGYVCPDLGSRLIGHMHFRTDVQRASIAGLGCAAALPTLQRACDFARAYPGQTALMLAVEICSACHYIDNTLETVVGNAICADGAAAFLLNTHPSGDSRYPEIVAFGSAPDSQHLDKVGLEQRGGKLRIVLAPSIRDLGPPLIASALDPLLHRNGLAKSDIRFWVVHPGGRKVIDNVQNEMKLTDAQLQFSRTVMRNYGNMSSPTVMYVLDEVVRSGDPQPGDWGVMIALGPGMAAETALLRW
ncbi:MAG: type III polyketide synthase [Acidobacteriota bacterium]|nr:type III polyketide synthase [Acidobacteriota bacterium]